MFKNILTNGLVPYHFVGIFYHLQQELVQQNQLPYLDYLVTENKVLYKITDYNYFIYKITFTKFKCYMLIVV